jgi:hypothetical protein
MTTTTPVTVALLRELRARQGRVFYEAPLLQLVSVNPEPELSPPSGKLVSV